MAEKECGFLCAHVLWNVLLLITTGSLFISVAQKKQIFFDEEYVNETNINIWKK